MTDDITDEEAQLPAGGWGSAKATLSILWQEHVVVKGSKILLRQNKPDGFACVSCSWAKPAKPHVIEACENGIKATAWEVTSKTATAAFFAEHTVAELETWSDWALEAQGRLTEPLKWDPASDKYLPVSWRDAFADIGTRLRELHSPSVIFYASGRASLETAYLYQLLARLYGCNNLPDSSNMCHESTSVGLAKTIGVPIGTVGLDDFEHTDCIFFFGQNVGTNSPRMLHQLQDARRRDVPIVTFNPLRERGLVNFVDPLSPRQMLTGPATPISTQYLQVKVGGDLAAITGLCKVLLELDRAAQGAGRPRVLDVDFIAAHTQGLEEFVEFVDAQSWPDIERDSGILEDALRLAAETYANASRVIGIYGMGLTQHRRGVENVQMVSNLLLLRGNMGKPGAGICPVRGHSNVQGQRTVGITEKPELAPLDLLAERYQFNPPRNLGRNTVDACRGILDGSVRAFMSLGGNFVRAVPETALIETAWRALDLTVQIMTRFNRTSVVHGRCAYLLPCLGRSEIDLQASGAQTVSVEDSTGCMHASHGVTNPIAASLLSEPAIIAGIAEATLPPKDSTPWARWTENYGLVRDEIAAIYPEIFHDFNARLGVPGGFRRPMPVARRVWKTPNGKANFITPRGLDEDPDMTRAQGAILRLMTMRSDDQFNTTVYSLNDRFRGIHGDRRVLLMNTADLANLGFQAGDRVDVTTVAHDSVIRTVQGFRTVSYDIPLGCVAGYFPECNPLIPLWHHAEGSAVPAAKSIPIRLTRPTG